MTRASFGLVLLIVALCAVIAAGPTIVALAHALVPFVLVVGLVVAVLRLVWHFTNWHR